MLQIGQKLFGLNRDDRLKTFEEHKFIEMYIVGITVIKNNNININNIEYHIKLSYFTFIDIYDKNSKIVISSTLDTKSLFLREDNIILYTQRESIKEEHLKLFENELKQKKIKLNIAKEEIQRLEDTVKFLKL